MIEQDNDLVIRMSSNHALSSGQAEANIVVTVGRIVVVPIGGTAVPAIVDP